MHTGLGVAPRLARSMAGDVRGGVVDATGAGERVYGHRHDAVARMASVATSSVKASVVDG